MSDITSGQTPPPSGQTGTGTSSTSDVQNAGRDLADAAARKLKETRDAAVHEVEARAEGAKEGAAEEVASIGNAFRKASGEMRHGSPQERAFAGIADALAEVSDGIRGKDFSDMIGDVSEFARRNPVAFLGGAALLGFAAVRMARASQRNPRPGDVPGDYGGGYSQGERRSYETQGATTGPAVRPAGAPGTTGASAASGSTFSGAAGSAGSSTGSTPAGGAGGATAGTGTRKPEGRDLP